jgi:hypothetical protein
VISLKARRIIKTTLGHTEQRGPNTTSRRRSARQTLSPAHNERRSASRRRSAQQALSPAHNERRSASRRRSAQQALSPAQIGPAKPFFCSKRNYTSQLIGTHLHQATLVQISETIESVTVVPFCIKLNRRKALRFRKRLRRGFRRRDSVSRSGSRTVGHNKQMSVLVTPHIGHVVCKPLIVPGPHDLQHISPLPTIPSIHGF